MNRLRTVSAATFLLMLLASNLSAQQEPEQQDRMPDMPMMQRGGQEPSDKMEHMADAMASMAETCQTMMEREMAGYPWRMVGLGTFCVPLLSFC